MLKKLLILTFITTISFANILKIGDTLTPFSIPDQFDELHTINSEKYQTVIVSFSKESSTKVNDFLQKQEKHFLKNNNIVYISDIHKMPSIITWLFALPKMKKFDYKVMLLYKENTVFPQNNKDLSIIRFKNNKVSSIEFIKENESIDSIFN
ncbi:MAG: hypothetical protein K8R39_10865 [Arcobacteraceae bacterium]|nr:hypothetical protein [Arcobacteraceae bacterium]